VLLVWLTLTVLGGGLAAVWSAFLITSPITATLTWRRFRSRVPELEAKMQSSEEEAVTAK
jgi:hypothetical protein